MWGDFYQVLKSFRLKLETGTQEKKQKKKEYDFDALFIKPVRIYIDTCSLLKANSLDFVNEISVVAKNKDQKITLFKSVIRELEKVSNEKPYMKERADNILRELYRLKNDGLVEMIEGNEMLFSDANLLEVVTKEIRTMNIVIISNDSKLTNAAKRIFEALLPAVHTKYTLKVMAI